MLSLYPSCPLEGVRAGEAGKVDRRKAVIVRLAAVRRSGGSEAASLPPCRVERLTPALSATSPVTTTTSTSTRHGQAGSHPIVECRLGSQLNTCEPAVIYSDEYKYAA